MYIIGFKKWDPLLIRFKRGSGDSLDVGYVRYYLRDGLEPTTFKTKKEAEDILDIIKRKDIEFVNDSIKRSIVIGSNIDKSQLEIFEI